MLTDIIKYNEQTQYNEQTHTNKHCGVFLHGNAHVCKHLPYNRFSNSICNGIAYGNVGDESDNNSQTPLFVLKSIIFIQKITQNTADNIIRSG